MRRERWQRPRPDGTPWGPDARVSDPAAQCHRKAQQTAAAGLDPPAVPLNVAVVGFEGEEVPGGRELQEAVPGEGSPPPSDLLHGVVTVHEIEWHVPGIGPVGHGIRRWRGP